MMTKKIKLKRGVAGGVYTYAAGQVVDAPADRADDLVRAGHAILVEEAPRSAKQPENTFSKAAKKAEKR